MINHRVLRDLPGADPATEARAFTNLAWLSLRKSDFDSESVTETTTITEAVHSLDAFEPAGENEPKGQGIGDVVPKQ